MLLYQRLYSIILVTLIITAAALFAVYVKLENIDIGTEGQFQLIQTKNIVEQQKQAQQQTYQQGTGKQSEQQKDVGQQILTVQENKVSTKTYFYGSSLLASRSNNIVTYYHDDYLGSVRLQSDTNARKTFSTRTLPFGSDVAESGSAAGSENSYKFTGQEQDDSLYYYGARYYDTRTGRFTQLDPAPSAESPYAYVSNNPLAFTDPTGKSMLDAELRAYNGGGYSGEELRQAGTDLIEWNNLPMSRAVDVTQMPFLGRLIVSGPFAARDPVAEDLYFFGYLSSAARAAGNVQARVPRVPKASPGIWSVALAGEKFLASETRGIGAVRAGDETIVRFIYLVDRKQIIFVPKKHGHEAFAAKLFGVERDVFLSNTKMSDRTIGGSVIVSNEGAREITSLYVGNSGIEIFTRRNSPHLQEAVMASKRFFYGGEVPAAEQVTEAIGYRDRKGTPVKPEIP